MFYINIIYTHTYTQIHMIFKQRKPSGHQFKSYSCLRDVTHDIQIWHCLANKRDESRVCRKSPKISPKKHIDMSSGRIYKPSYELIE